MTHTHRDFFHDLLLELGLPVRTAGLRAMACVNLFENTEGNLRWNNPLACEQKWPPVVPTSTPLPPWRDPAAQVYRSFRDGILASAYMFAGPHWDGVRKAFGRSYTRGPVLDAFTAAYTWADIDFRSAWMNEVPTLDARLDHPLLPVLR